MIDITTISLICASLLIAISYIISYKKNKRFPPVETVLSLTLFGQAIISGGSMVIYSFTENQFFFINNRIILFIGGIALFAMGFDNCRKRIKEIYEERV